MSFQTPLKPVVTEVGIVDSSLNKVDLEALSKNVSSIQQTSPSSQRQIPHSQKYFLTQQSDPDNIWQNASFPLEKFQAYTSPFGIRSSPDGSTESEFHYGLDMAAPEGSYVRNWWSGQVIEVSDNTNCGTSAVIQSGEWTHKYCHMSGYVEVIEGQPFLIDPEGSLQLQQGQLILAGFRIGRVGMTGRTTGPHLHWILKYGSNWVDPGLVLQAMYAAQQSP
jgi:murein DD-endopeptidase MepM/ murein hydrolase activator NlpD